MKAGLPSPTQAARKTATVVFGKSLDRRGFANLDCPASACPLAHELISSG
jgi:hypothetical protein